MSSVVEPLSGVCFDHVGLALHRPTDLWPIMADALGGRHAGSGDAPGYGWNRLRFANGFVVEGLFPDGHLEPADDGADPTFLARFLERSGAGPHHLTFTVESLDAALGALADAGVAPAITSRSDPDWIEAVLHPSDGFGIVVQLAQVGEGYSPSMEAPEAFPERAYERPVASLGRVVHAVADLTAALVLFRDVLGGRVVSSGSAIDGNHWVELGWGGPGRLRLLEGAHAEIAEWIGDRAGRLRHLFFNFDEPSHLPGARQVAPGRWVIDPEHVLGTRIVLASSAR